MMQSEIFFEGLYHPCHIQFIDLWQYIGVFVLTIFEFLLAYHEGHCAALSGIPSAFLPPVFLRILQVINILVNEDLKPFSTV